MPVLAALTASIVLAGCAPAEDGPLVFAASSLADVLPAFAPGARYSFDGSAGLVDQLNSGAPADVFASADRRTMDRAVALGLIDGDPVGFASNRLVIAVADGNPAGITGFDESLNSGRLVMCAPEVPCGALADELATDAGLTLSPVSEETKVTDVLGKVESGEADAGLVYATDAAGSVAVDTLEIPGAADAPNTYWVAVVRGAGQPDAARVYVDSLTGQWQDDLAAAGFGPP